MLPWAGSMMRTLSATPLSPLLPLLLAWKFNVTALPTATAFGTALRLPTRPAPVTALDWTATIVLASASRLPWVLRMLKVALYCPVGAVASGTL